MTEPNKDTIWVSPTGSESPTGSYENPYADLTAAFRKVTPGQRVVLKDGEYQGNVTFEKSGTTEYPIRLSAENPGKSVIYQSSWYFYDTSDLIVEGLVFKESPHGAVSVIGKCERNCFRNIAFIECGKKKDTACTLYFGGSSGRCNVIENCSFYREKQDMPEVCTVDNASIAVMIAEGDNASAVGGARNEFYQIRGCRFTHYGYAVLLGSSDANASQYGHLIEENIIEHCIEGITVKCGDTRIRRNKLNNVTHTAISVIAGESSEVTGNRITDCKNGIVVCGRGQTIKQNCIIHPQGNALHVSGQYSLDILPASNVFFENNTIIDTPRGAGQAGEVVNIRIDPGTSCIIEKNLVDSVRQPYQTYQEIEYLDGSNKISISDTAKSFIVDNISTGSCESNEGFSTTTVTFQDPEKGNYSTESDYGAGGWAVSGTLPVRSVDSESQRDELDVDELGHVADAAKKSHPLWKDALFFEEDPGRENSAD